MKCAACHGEMLPKKGEIELRVQGTLYLVEDVSYEECGSCGERVLSPAVSKNIFDKLKAQQYEKKNICLPVVEGNAAVAE